MPLLPQAIKNREDDDKWMRVIMKQRDKFWEQDTWVGHVETGVFPMGEPYDITLNKFKNSRRDTFSKFKSKWNSET